MDTVAQPEVAATGAPAGMQAFTFGDPSPVLDRRELGRGAQPG